jgi:hypothetical protein
MYMESELRKSALDEIASRSDMSLKDCVDHGTSIPEFVRKNEGESVWVIVVVA